MCVGVVVVEEISVVLELLNVRYKVVDFMSKLTGQGLIPLLSCFRCRAMVVLSTENTKLSNIQSRRPEVGQNVALCVLPAARNSALLTKTFLLLLHLCLVCVCVCVCVCVRWVDRGMRAEGEGFVVVGFCFAFLFN